MLNTKNFDFLDENALRVWCKLYVCLWGGGVLMVVVGVVGPLVCYLL